MENSGTVRVDHHRFMFGDGEADFTREVASGSLVVAGPGVVTVLTGVAYGPVFVRVCVLPTLADGEDPRGWEVVEEATVRLGGAVAARSLDGVDVVPPAGAWPGAGWYRVRVYGRGRDARWDMDVSEPSEEYLVAAAPTRAGPPALERLRKTDLCWEDEDEDGATSVQPPPVYDELSRWGGSPPGPQLASIAHLYGSEAAQYVARHDRPLADAVAAAPPGVQRAVAVWAAAAAYDFSGLSAVGWASEGLRALGEGAAPPAPFDEMARAFDMLQAGRYPQLRGPVPHATIDDVEVLPWYFALGTVEAARHEEPVSAAMMSLGAAIGSYGARWPELTASLKAEFFPSS